MNTTIEFYIFELVQVPNFTLNNFEFLDKTNFLDQVFPKREFPLNSQIRISLGAKFQLKLTPLIFFWPNLLKKNICSLKQKRSENQHWILPIRIKISTNFSWNWQFRFFFGPNLLKWGTEFQYKLRRHPQMHLLWDSGFFPLFSESPPPPP